MEIPYGYCRCGCGGKTTISPQTVRKLGYVAGEPRPYIRNHDKRAQGPRYEIDPVTGCWLWTGATNPKGYGQMRVEGEKHMQYAHRVFYERAKGPIPSGMFLDHTCHDPDTCVGGPECPHRRCVNPDHLEPVTNRENSYRGQTRPGSTHKPGRKPKPLLTHCKRGHEFTPENTIVPADGARRCRACDNLRQREAWRRKHGKKGAEPE